ncbi:MAG: NPCBM/NEW2 domain-containing protein [Pirellulales bacterium]
MSTADKQALKSKALHKELGIPPREQPPTAYRILGLSDFETDKDVIQAAYYRRVDLLKQVKSGEFFEIVQGEILNDVTLAYKTLTKPEQRAVYDEALHPRVDTSAQPIAQQPQSVLPALPPTGAQLFAQPFGQPSGPPLSQPFALTPFPPPTQAFAPENAPNAIEDNPFAELESAVKPSPAQPPAMKKAMNPLPWVIAAGVGLTAIILVVVMLLQSDDAPEQTDPANIATKPNDDERNTVPPTETSVPNLLVPDTDPAPGPSVSDGAAIEGMPSQAELTSGFASDRAVDLLKLIDPKRDAFAGTWAFENGVLQMPKAYISKLDIPYVLPKSYALRIVANKIKGDVLVVGLMVDGKRCTAQFRKSLAGLDLVDKKGYDKNESTLKGDALGPGKYEVRICVAPGIVTAHANGREIIVWRGDAARLSLADDWGMPFPDHPMIGGHDTSQAIETLQLLPLDAAPVAPIVEAASPVTEAFASERAIDLLKIGHPTRDSVVGSWRYSTGALYTADARGGRMVIPFVPPRAYIWKIVGKPYKGQDLVMGFIIDGRQVTMNIEHNGGGKSSLGVLDGKQLLENATKIEKVLFQPNTEYVIYLTVTPTSVALRVDGQDAVVWNGAATRLSMGPQFRVPRKDCLFLGSWQSIHRITESRLLPIGVDGSLDPTPSPRTEPVDPRAPLPDPVATTKARDEFRELFKADFAAPPAKQSVFAEKLFSLAKDEKDSAGRYMLYGECRTVALAAGQLELALKAVRAVAAEYRIDETEAILAMLKAFPQKQAGGTMTKAQWTQLAKASLELASERFAHDDFAGCGKFLDLVVVAAPRGADANFAKSMVDAKADLAAYQEAARAAADAEKVLATTPDDPAANRTSGLFFTLALDDRERGLARLAKGDEGDLRRIAGLELQQATTVESARTLADAWSMLKIENSALSGLASKRAIVGLQSLAADASGLTKLALDKRLKELQDRRKNESMLIETLTAARPKSTTTSGEFLIDRPMVDLKRPYDYQLRKGFYLNGQESPNGIFLHSGQPASYAAFQLNGEFAKLSGMVGFDDQLDKDPIGLHEFVIYGDGAELWRSKPTQRRGPTETQKFDVDVRKVEVLQIATESLGTDVGRGHGVWFEPKLSR